MTPSPSTGRSLSRSILSLLLLAPLTMGGCVDRYLIPDSHLRAIANLNDEERAHVALPAYRVPGAHGTWVRADQIIPGNPVAGQPGYRHAQEAPNYRRLSTAGLGSLFLGALSLGLAGAFTANSDCATSNPCFAGAGDSAVPLAVTGATLLSLGFVLQLARAVEHHPAEPGMGDGEIIFLNAPALGSGGATGPSAPSRTPIE